MKKAILVPNGQKDPSLALTRAAVGCLVSLGIIAYIDEEYQPLEIEDARFYSEIPKDADFIIVIGGDGSFIDASGLALELDIPIIGINLGKVGYLATVEPDRLDLLSIIAEGGADISENMLLVAEKHYKDGSITSSERLAVNDVVISHDSYLGISDIRLENGGGDAVHYRADGIILATPQGSTAYSLSAGGPIISHGIDSITVTPICPHSFFNRSIVYGPDEKIRISNMNEDVLNISVDGRLFTRLNKGESCLVYRSDKRIKTYNLEDTNLFSTLSKKIKLLQDLV